MQRIATPADIERGLDALCLLDPRLPAVRARADAVPLRLTEPGFASLVSIIVSQQVSRASADAIMARLRLAVPEIGPDAILSGGEDLLRAAGFSRPKIRSVLGLARAVAVDELDLEALCAIPPAHAMAALVSLPGVGPWTAEVYLLFAAGHPDIFPAKDVALQSAVGRAFDIAPRPDERTLAAIAESWSPWRGVAARLFWAYYAATRGREAAPAA